MCNYHLKSPLYANAAYGVGLGFLYLVRVTFFPYIGVQTKSACSKVLKKKVIYELRVELKILGIPMMDCLLKFLMFPRKAHYCGFYI